MTTDATDNLQLPYLMASQAQKHVTLNESLRMLDAIVQLSVAEVRSIPPTTPAAGARYIVGASPTGDWVGQAGRIAAWQDGVWAFLQPQEGWWAWVAAEARRCDHVSGAWSAASSQGAAQWGVNAAADATTRLVVKAAASLFTAETADHRVSIDKASAAGTASLIFSDAFSGRAEIGLAGGDDDLCVKVSADGATWREALRIDRTDGRVSFPSGAPDIGTNLLLNGDFAINQRAFAGGALAAGAFGFDRWKAATGGATLSRAATGVITLTAGSVAQVIEPAIWDAASLADQALTFSLESLSGGSLTVQVGSASAVLTGGAGVRSATLQTSVGDTGPLTVRLSVASGTPAFRRAKLEPGRHATPWRARSGPEELRLCQRYFEASAPTGQPPATYAPGAGEGSIKVNADPNLGSATPVRFLVPKRTTPTLIIRDGAGQSGRISGYASGWTNNLTYTGVFVASDKGFSLQQNNGGVFYISFDYAADAEL